MPRLLISCLLLALAAPPARASDTYAWLRPPPEQQLAADDQEIPVGKGAVFVPSITGATFEPPATLVAGDTLQSVNLEERVMVDPGQYVVVLSSGTPAQGVGIPVEVKEGETTLVPVKWGALRIEVTDDKRIPHRGSYEILRADSREPVGMGFGADTLQGEILQTWILAPGLYRIVLPGRNYRGLRDFATVEVPQAGFVRYRLVQDPDTHEFLGAGVLLPDEFSTALSDGRRWFRTVVVGFDGSMVHSENVVGAFNQVRYDLSGYLDAQLAFNAFPHRFSTLLQVEEGISRILPQDGEPQPLVKSTDRVRGDGLYTYSFYGRTGPYARVSADSSALPTEVVATEDTTVVVNELDGSATTVDVAANDTFRLAEAGFPTLLREGVGINTSFARKNMSNNFNFRFGYGMRQNLYGGALVTDDHTDTDAVEYTAVDSFFEEGLEATVVATVRLPGWVVYTTDVEVFADFGSFTSPWTTTDTLGLPVPPWAVSWQNTLSLRITRNLSLNYYLDVEVEPQVIDKPQVEQSLYLRTSWSL